MIRTKKGDDMPKKYDFVQGRLTHDEEGVCTRLAKAARGKLKFQMIFFSKVSDDECIAIFEYEEPQEMSALGEVVSCDRR